MLLSLALVTGTGNREKADEKITKTLNLKG